MRALLIRINFLLCSADGQPTVNPRHVFLVVGCRPSQVAQECEQIWVGHLHTPSKRRVETFHRIVGSRRAVAHRKPRGTDCGFLKPLLLDVMQQLLQLLVRGRACLQRPTRLRPETPIRNHLCWTETWYQLLYLFICRKVRCSRVVSLSRSYR